MTESGRGEEKNLKREPSSGGKRRRNPSSSTYLLSKKTGIEEKKKGVGRGGEGVPPRISLLRFPTQGSATPIKGKKKEEGKERRKEREAYVFTPIKTSLGGREKKK